MSKRLSQEIVDFIGGLLPLYTHELHEGVWCARSLQDGTLIRAVLEDDDNENGDVEVRWQGDALRSTTTRGSFVASVAIARWAELMTVAEHPKHLASSEVRHLSQHFTVKTGEEVVFSPQNGNGELFQLIGRAIGELGKEALIQLLRTKLGV